MIGSTGSDGHARVLFGMPWILCSTVVEQMDVHTHPVGGAPNFLHFALVLPFKVLLRMAMGTGLRRTLNLVGICISLGMSDG